MVAPLEVLAGSSRPQAAVCRQFRVAVDLDNTLICYDRVFVEAACNRGLVPDGFVGGKQAVRDQIRQLPDGETLWQELQGEVYGGRINGAVLFDGAMNFLRRCHIEGAHVWIVSHKTQFNSHDPERVDLREAARRWLELRVFGHEGLGLGQDDVFFEETRQAKVARLVSLQCTHVIDDLVEVFSEPGFPDGMRRIRFDPACPTGDGSWASWPEIEMELYGHAQPNTGIGGTGDVRSI
ncbi:MAG TPA: hypothetical protein VME46_23165 [Acidimicrobiales bacterium]|nr:hypothetical protein [Acidimicrobiales bacterium]